MKKEIIINNLFTAVILLTIPPAILLFHYRPEQIIDYLMLYAGIVLVEMLFLIIIRRIPHQKEGEKNYFLQLTSVDYFICWLLLIIAIPPDFTVIAIPCSLFILLGTVYISSSKVHTLYILAITAGFLIIGWLADYEDKFGAAGFDTYMAIFQTNPAEAINYYFDYLNIDTVLCASCYFLWRICLQTSPWQKIYHESKRRKQYRSVSSMLAICAVISLWLNSQPIVDRYIIFSGSFKKYQQTIAEQMQMSEKLKQVFANTRAQEISFGFQGNIVFVLGESTTRRHMSLYGYHRKTTPELDALQNQLFIQRDTVAPHSYTIFSVPEILNVDINKKPEEYSQTPDLLTALKSGGYETYWLSNQNEFGAWDNIVSLLGKNADQYLFNRKTFGELFRGDYYDHQLLPILRDYIGSPGNKAAFVHLYATHGDYCKGIPENYRSYYADGREDYLKYSGKLEIDTRTANCYDNAIRYLDSTLADIIAMVRAQEKPSIFIYVADHGEHAFDESGHNSSKHSAYHVDVPMFFYFNDEAKQRLVEHLNNFNQNAESPFIARDTYHSLIDLLQPSAPIFTPEKSLFSVEYTPSQRDILCHNGECVDYDNPAPGQGHDYLERARANLLSLKLTSSQRYKRVWAHRVNTLGKLMEAKPLFSGVEFDVVFDEKHHEFFVFHPPRPNIGLTLGEYLEAASDHPDLSLWFDWKNAGADNINAAVIRLNELDEQHQLKSRTIVETGSHATTPLLRRLSEQGYRHSYYAPTTELKTCQEDLDSIRCTELAESINKAALQTGASIISFDYTFHKFFKHFSEKFNRNGFLTWNLEVDMTRANTLSNLHGINDYEGYLVSFPTIYDY